MCAESAGKQTKKGTRNPWVICFENKHKLIVSYVWFSWKIFILWSLCTEWQLFQLLTTIQVFKRLLLVGNPVNTLIKENDIVLITLHPVKVNRAVPFDKKEILDFTGFFHGKIRIMQFLWHSLRFNLLTLLTYFKC